MFSDEKMPGWVVAALPIFTAGGAVIGLSVGDRHVVAGGFVGVVAWGIVVAYWHAMSTARKLNAATV
jgi:hypothetical protein